MREWKCPKCGYTESVKGNGERTCPECKDFKGTNIKLFCIDVPTYEKEINRLDNE